MGKFEDLTGQRFGRLTVIERAENQYTAGGNSKVMWRCHCDCGNEKNIGSGELKSGDTRSCGCLHKEQVSQTMKKDLTGKKFGRLTVLYQTAPRYSPNGIPATIYHCLCDCSQEVDIRGCHLSSGATQSCGCLHRETVKNIGHQNKKENLYDLSGPYGIGYTSNNEKFYFDLEDYNKIKNYCWWMKNDGYICAQDNQSGETIQLHRFIMNLHNISSNANICVDHIKTEDKFDNRKCNLRIVEQYKNNQNHRLYNSNTSGVSGVTFQKSNNKWIARISYKNKRYHLGIFDNFEDAVAARKKAEEKYFGEHSYDNSQKLASKNSISHTGGST